MQNGFFAASLGFMNRHLELLNSLEVSEEELVLFKDDNPGFCGVDTARVSHLLLAQLSSIRKYRVLNSFAVTDVIQKLEGVGRAGLEVHEKAFKHLPLKGLWKAHFFDASFLMRNLVNEWGLEFVESKKFETLCASVSADEEHNPSPHGWQGRLTHQFTIGGFKARAQRKKMTGEWIIFGRHEGKNHYLCVAKHSTSKESDEEIYAGIKYFCELEYPFLFTIET